MSKGKVLLSLFGIFVFAYVLRVWFLPQKSLTFGYDQARDAYISQQILSGDLKIQGPPASTPGLYHGVFYYYFLAPAYAFGKNPINAAYWIAFFNSATVFIVFTLGYLMTKKLGVGILAAFLFAISFESTQYATWLSNPTIGIWTVPLIYLGLWSWIHGKRWGPVVAALGLGLSIQSEIFLAYHLIPVVIWLWASRKEVAKKQISIFLIILLLSLSSMILNEAKFGFRGIGGLRLLATGSGTTLAYAKSIGDYLILYLNQIGRIFSFNTYPGNIGYGGSFIIILAVYGMMKGDTIVKFLSTWLFSHLTVVTVGGTSTPFLMVGIGPAVSLIIAYHLYKWWTGTSRLAAPVVLAIIVFGNISTIAKENPGGATLFAIQKDMLLSKELQAIDYSYEKTGGSSFSLNSLTSPLWTNIVWTYLYKWYGKETYGYTPTWHGRDQVGLLDTLDKTPELEKRYFLILEPMGGIPPQYLEMTLQEEESRSRLINEAYFGELRIQERNKL